MYGRFGLLAADVLAFGISAALVVGLRTQLWGAMPLSSAMWVGAAVWFLLRAEGGMYSTYSIAPPEELRRGTLTTLVALLAHGAMLFALNQDRASRFIALGMWVVLILAAWISRGAVKFVLVKKGLYGVPVIVAGAGETGRLLVRALQKSPHHGLRPVAIFDDDPELHGRDIEGVPVVGPLNAALSLKCPYRIRHALLAMPGAGRQRVVSFGHRLSSHYESVSVVPDLLGMASLWVRARNVGPMLTLEFRHDRFKKSSLRWKRAFDLVVGVPLFFASVPLVAICAAAVKMLSPGPAFYAQTREGRDGVMIKVWKIRTMVQDAELRLDEYLRSNDAARSQWERSMKLEDDPRIIPVVGKLLRRWSLDEFPQLWSVVTGQMSLVGPRPFPEYHLRRFPLEFRELRRQVPPGVSGFWQITERSTSDLLQQEAADSYYIHNWSLWLDLWVTLRTFSAVLAGKGAY